MSPPVGMLGHLFSCVARTSLVLCVPDTVPPVGGALRRKAQPLWGRSYQGSLGVEVWKHPSPKGAEDASEALEIWWVL